MKIFVRTDATATVGTGHLMRCLALVDALKRKGLSTVFLSYRLPDALAALIAKEGHGLETLNCGGDWEDDAAATAAVLSRHKGHKYMIVDHYGLGQSWEAHMRPYIDGLMAIDDMGRHHDCDLLLDQNILDPADHYADRIPGRCKRLLGPRYTLLRPQFAAARSRLRCRDGLIRRVLINFGGSDPTGMTESAIQGFVAAGLDNADADVVLGAANQRTAILLARYSGQPRLRIAVHTDKMADMMAAADLAIGAGGSSVWERCCVGLPGITIPIAENQLALCHALARRNMISLIENSNAVEPDEIADDLKRLNKDRGHILKMSKLGLDLVDGFGADRVAGEIC